MSDSYLRCYSVTANEVGTMVLAGCLSTFSAVAAVGFSLVALLFDPWASIAAIALGAMAFYFAWNGVGLWLNIVREHEFDEAAERADLP